MKIIKKLLCVLLSIAALLCCCVSASAAEPRITFVGTLSIFACSDGTGSSLGTTDHAFISFKNTSSQQIRVGGLNVNPGHEITVGAWGTKPASHELGNNETWQNGICYNIESHLVNYDNGFSNRVSLTMSVTMSDVETIRKAISTAGSYNPASNNCATFAVKVWNSVAASGWRLSSGFPNQPVTLYNNIKNKSGYQSNRSIMNITPVGYVNGSGNFVALTLICAHGGGGQHRSAENICAPDTMEVS